MKLKTDRFMWLESIKENKSTALYWGYLAIIGVIFYLMNCYTPLHFDDFHYQYKFGTRNPIENISDIFESQYTHYFQINGRFISHFILQFFMGIASKELFNIANTTIFLLFIHLLPMVITKRIVNNIKLTTIFLFFIVIFSSMFGKWYLWTSGACNYLWPATFLTLFHHILFKENIHISIYPLLFILGILSGWSHESIVIGAAISYFIYFLNNKDQITTARLLQLFGFYIGIILLIISPGNINRALNTGTLNSPNLMNYIWTIISFKELSILYILICILFYCFYKKKLFNFINNNIYIIISLIISIIFIVFIKVGNSRAHFGIFFYSLILVFKFISNMKNKKFIFNFSLLTLSIGAFPLLTIAANNYKEYQNLILQIKNTNDGIIMTNEVKVHPFIDKYIVKLYTSETNEFYNGYDKTNAENKSIANAFNKHQIIFIPNQFIKEINNNPEAYNEFIIPTHHPFYAKKINIDTIQKVTYLLNKTETKDIPFYFRPFSSKLDRFNLIQSNATQWSTLTINNELYLLVGKNWTIDKRLKDIIYE